MGLAVLGAECNFQGAHCQPQFGLLDSWGVFVGRPQEGQGCQEAVGEEEADEGFHEQGGPLARGADSCFHFV